MLCAYYLNIIRSKILFIEQKNENYPSLPRSVNEISLDGMLDYTGNTLITYYKCAELFR